MTAIALIQDVALTRVSILGSRPDLLFLVVVGWTFMRGSTEGAVWAFIGGLLLDVFSGGPFGSMTLALLLVTVFVGRQWGRELGSVILQLVLLTLVSCFAYHALLLLTLSGTGHVVDWGYSLAQVAAPSAFLNALLAPFVYWPLAWLDRSTKPRGLTLNGA